MYKFIYLLSSLLLFGCASSNTPSLDNSSKSESSEAKSETVQPPEPVETKSTKKQSATLPEESFSPKQGEAETETVSVDEQELASNEDKQISDNLAEEEANIEQEKEEEPKEQKQPEQKDFEQNHPQAPDEEADKAPPTQELPELKQVSSPTLPVIPVEFSPNIKAPPKFKHPLKDSTNLIFMLGEDDQGYYLYGEGAIAQGAYEKFLKYVNYYQKKGIELSRLMLHSPGGLLNEGLKIGQYVRENKWTTDSDKYMKCYSSCGMIFVAGTKKRIQSGAEVGFHRPYLFDVPDTESYIKRVYTSYMPYWESVGGDKALYDDFMLNYGREDMLILDSTNIDKYMKVKVY